MHRTGMSCVVSDVVSNGCFGRDIFLYFFGDGLAVAIVAMYGL